MTDTQLMLADIGLDIFHLVIVFFLMFGWILRKTRPLHRIAVAVTSFLWVVVGAFVGKIGYCPVTDWHWQVKKLRGEEGLPVSYIDYQLQRIGIHLPPENADMIVMAVFVAIVLITIFLFWREKKQSV